VLEEDQARLLQESRDRRLSRTVDVASIDEAVEAAATGWGRMPWADLGPEGEAKLAEQGVSVRCLVAEDGSVPTADDAPGTIAVVARAY
jgi:prolyl-tRNA synthetase